MVISVNFIQRMYEWEREREDKLEDGTYSKQHWENNWKKYCIKIKWDKFEIEECIN